MNNQVTNWECKLIISLLNVEQMIVCWLPIESGRKHSKIISIEIFWLKCFESKNLKPQKWLIHEMK